MTSFFGFVNFVGVDLFSMVTRQSRLFIFLFLFNKCGLFNYENNKRPKERKGIKIEQVLFH